MSAVDLISYAPVEIVYAFILIPVCGICGIVAYKLSGRIARLAKRRQTPARIVVWSILFILVLSLPMITISTHPGMDTWHFFDTSLSVLRLLFWPYYYPYDPLPFISLSIWLLGVVLITREDLKRVIQRFSRRSLAQHALAGRF